MPSPPVVDVDPEGPVSELDEPVETSPLVLGASLDVLPESTSAPESESSPRPAEAPGLTPPVSKEHETAAKTRVDAQRLQAREDTRRS